MAAKKSSQSKNKAGWILFIVTVIVLAVCILIIKFPPRIKDGAWHDERRIVFIAKGVLYGAVFALVGLVATNGMSKKDVLLIPVPVMVGLLPVILAVVGLIYGFRATPNQYLVMDGAAYTLEEGKVCIEHYGKGQGPDYEIPSSVEGYPLVYIDNGCFRGASIESVSIPGTVTGIGKRAFAGADVQKVVLYGQGSGDETLTLMSGAFKRCKSLQTVICLRENTEIEQNVFRGDSVLQNVYFGGDCLIKGSGVFMGCPKLQSVACGGSFGLGENAQHNPFNHSPEAVLYCDDPASPVLRREAVIEKFSEYKGPVK